MGGGFVGSPVRGSVESFVQQHLKLEENPA